MQKFVLYIFTNASNARYHDELQVNRFKEAFAVVRKFLDHANSILAVEDPNKSAEQYEIQARLDKLKQLADQFQVFIILNIKRCHLFLWISLILSFLSPYLSLSLPLFLSLSHKYT